MSLTLFEQIQNFDTLLLGAKVIGDEGDLRKSHKQELSDIFTLQKQILFDIERQLSSKIDRVEFSQIVENKANNQDIQVLVSQIMNIEELAKNQKLQNLLNESMFAGGGPDTTVRRDKSGYEEELQNLELFEKQLNQSPEKQEIQDQNLVTVGIENSGNKNQVQGYQSPKATLSLLQGDLEDAENKLHRLQTDMQEISCINENDMNLNQSALREALMTHNINENSTPSKIMTGKSNLKADTSPGEIERASPIEEKIIFKGPQLDQIQTLNNKVDDIYQSICNLVEKNCVSKQDLATFVVETNQKIKQCEKRVDEKTGEMGLKANKQSVANALHRKANKQDLFKIETDIVQKLDKVLKDIAAATSAQKDNKVLIESLFSKKSKSIDESLKKQVKKLQDDMAKQKLRDQAKERSRSKSETKNKDENKKMLDYEVEIKKFFRNYALELYGSSILEQVDENSLGLKVIFDRIFENHFQKYNVDNQFEECIQRANKKLSNEMTEQINDEIEQIQLQINSLRSQVQTKNKKTGKKINFDESFGEQDEATVNSNQMRHEIDALKTAVQNNSDMLTQKSDIKDVCALVDLKANSTDVFKIFDEMKKSIQFLSSSSQGGESSSKMFDNFLQEQKFINENLCPLNCIAQYVWHGGFTLGSILGGTFGEADKFGQSSFFAQSQKGATAVVQPKGQKNTEAIKWTKESINTAPTSIELGRGDDDSGSIILAQEGIYQVSFILFLPEGSNPKISLMMEDQQIMSSIDAAQNIIFHKDSQRQTTFSCYINAETPNQKINVCLTQTSKLSNQGAHSRSSSSHRASANTSSSIFSSSIQTRKQNVMQNIVEEKKQPPQAESLHAQYHYYPGLTRAILMVRKL